MSKKPSPLMKTFAAPVSAPEPANDKPEKKARKKQLVFLVTPEQENRLTHLRADLGNVNIQTLFIQSINLMLESKGQPLL